MEWIAIIVCIVLFEWAVPTHMETGAVLEVPEVPEVQTHTVSDEEFEKAVQWEMANNKEITYEKAK